MKRKWWLLAGVLFCLTEARAETPPPSRIVLLGDSTYITSYLPGNVSHTAQLQEALDRRYGAGRAEVVNWADNGEYIARFLLTGKYDRLRAKAGGVDVFLMRYGVNDAKRLTPEEFGEHVKRFIEILQKDYPDAKFVLEDGIYVDSPAHYQGERNRKEAPYWEQTRRIAGERGFPLSAFFERSKAETLAGNWDLRIRRQIDGVVVMDASKDGEHAGDAFWFTDIHPNAEGVRVAVAAEMAVIEEQFPEKLPTGGRKAATVERTKEEYASLLNFSPDRLATRAKNNPDKLQDSSR